MRDWPGWIQFTLSGLAGACVSLVTVTLAFGEVRRDAKEAKAAAEALQPRMRTVEDVSSWLKAALRTGRDPDTGAQFPWAK